MHEFSLYGQLAESDHARLLQQLAGLCRMQPKSVEELHLVFKARPPAGLASIASSAESSGKQDVQRISKMLTSNIYMVQVVGEMSEGGPGSHRDVQMSNGHSSEKSTSKMSWYFEFNDTPDTGKHPVNGRLASRFVIEDGDIISFMKQFGYDYVSRYVVRGQRLYDQEQTLSVHRYYQAPNATDKDALDYAFMNNPEAMQLIDKSGCYVVKASVDTVDGSVAELKDRATTQLLAMRDTLKPVINLAPVDRLALDTRASAR